MNENVYFWSSRSKSSLMLSPILAEFKVAIEMYSIRIDCNRLKSAKTKSAKFSWQFTYYFSSFSVTSLSSESLDSFILIAVRFSVQFSSSQIDLEERFTCSRQMCEFQHVWFLKRGNFVYSLRAIFTWSRANNRIVWIGRNAENFSGG